MAIKGRLSLNELRYKNCFRLRATKYLVSIRDKDNNMNSPTSSASSSNSNNQVDLNEGVEEYHWLRNNLTIKEWLNSIDGEESWK